MQLEEGGVDKERQAKKKIIMSGQGRWREGEGCSVVSPFFYAHLSFMFPLRVCAPCVGLTPCLRVLLFHLFFSLFIFSPCFYSFPSHCFSCWFLFFFSIVFESLREEWFGFTYFW
ncbi:hypothetical protein TRSC58_07341 [Trypanosoma rangeli SC58]|uniref:Transmembrane protein n=1 Tax=Trypanosoma rangeli SC58 TaxID=429131 RepID=A0A061IRN9_TRYRA|nr:hypothetical protein TRSC58_07341 [Trypanosoma rangeli SC58]